MGLCCATSLFNLALLVMAVQDTFRMDVKEDLVLFTYENRRWKAERREFAAVVIQRFWRSSMSSNNPLIPMVQSRQWDKDINLARSIRCFRLNTLAQPAVVRNHGTMLQDTMVVTMEMDKK